VGTVSGQYSSSVPVGKVTSYTVSSLAQGTTYYFAVTAVNADGLESPYSAQVSRTIPVPAVPPSRPTGLLITSQNADLSTSLAWSANAETNIVGYRIHYGTASGQYSSSVQVGKVTGYTVSALARATTYYFAVSAINAAGLESQLSAEISGTTSSAEPPVEVYQDFTLTSDDRFFTLSFVNTPGKIFRVEASTDLKTWTALSTSFTDSTGYFSYSERRTASRLIRFFRVIPL